MGRTDIYEWVTCTQAHVSFHGEIFNRIRFVISTLPRAERIFYILHMNSIIQYLECGFFFEISNRSKVITTKTSRIDNFAIGRDFDIYGRDAAHSLDVLSGISTIPI